MAAHGAAGTVIDRLRIARYGYRFSQGGGPVEGGVQQGGWLTEAYTEDGQIRYAFGREACTVVSGRFECSFGSTDPNAPVDLDLDAEQVTYQVACIDGNGCDTANDEGFPFAAITIHNAVATIRDDVAPTLTAGGPLLAPGWRRPTDDIVVDADDVTGISASRRPPARPAAR